MQIQFLEAKSISASRERAMRKELDSIRKEFKVVPKLGILLVTGDQISMAMSDKVMRMGEAIGFEMYLDQVAERNVDRSFEKKLATMVEDASIWGIWVLTPRFDFPPYDLITKYLPAEKDLSGSHHNLLGRYMFGKPAVVPPKVRAVHDFLEEYVDGYLEKGVVIISTKNDGTRGFFGKYLAGYLYDIGARVTLRNVMSTSTKKDQVVELYNPLGEIIVTALNTSNVISDTHLKKGSWIIDTGYNFQRNRLCGDVNITSVKDKCAAITPVPGGVDALIPIEVLVNAVDIVKARTGIPRVAADRRRLGRHG
jgi:methylenetetrahydrofolate dehydrogenase (NADP+)/methenyltetrahydrofolate cyclohydrolase